MSTITIPKKIAHNKNLVAIPRDTSVEFLEWQRKIKVMRTFKPTAAQKKALLQARKNLSKGNYMTLAEFKRDLGITN